MPRLVRTNYFHGRLLDAADFQLEQSYHLNRSRRHNLRMHGSGVVRGLTVSLQKKGRQPIIMVSPGYAIDPLGNEVDLGQRAVLAIVCAARAFHVVIRQVERLIDPVPALGTAQVDEAVNHARVEEDSEVAVVPEDSILAPAPGDLILARFVKARAGWRRDPKRKPRRAR